MYLKFINHIPYLDCRYHLLSSEKAKAETSTGKNFSLGITSVYNLFKNHNLKNKINGAIPCPAASGSDKPTLDRVTQSQHALIQFQNSLVNVAENILRKFNVSADGLKSISEELNELSHGENRLLNPKEINKAKGFKKYLIRFIHNEMQGHNHKISLEEVKVLFNNEFKDILNSNEWKIVETELVYGNKKYSFVLIPASKMKYNNADNDIFYDCSYQNKGICSKSSDETVHAVNLWVSDVKDDQQNSLFTGIRHGVLSPFSLPEGSFLRKEGAKNRAKEVVIAALYSKPELYKKALNNEVVTLRISSTSLLTYMFGETSMLDDQIFAWDSLNNDPFVHLNIRDEKGDLKQVKIKLDIAILNFGVNELSLSMINRVSDGISDRLSSCITYKKNNLHQLNKSALEKIMGDDYLENNHLGGWVGNYLSENPHADNRHKIEILCQQIRDIWKNSSYNKDANEPYKMAQRIVMLTYEIDAVPCWNCKSGKDRTGMLDAEIKRETLSYHQNKHLGKPSSKLISEESQLFQDVLLQSGNLQIQEYNTGLVGNKVVKDLPLYLKPMALSYDARIGDRFIRQQVKGFSSLS
ncbi:MULTISPECIES: inositol phosphate phosphatase SopB [Providencia]|uniref:Inositol phosphatase n=2 Tax=Providencia stuartii TaxID=588 RepID=A0ABD5L254_PROST|nr:MULTISPECIES: inositol phosphate phosphatase SopB [Providencia]ELR5291538.1 inositol phosphatase [Providencia stuartii]MCR4180627.1 inositol phosphatase [Providencia vermicola]URE78209.1 inositol phosphatase [Providencia stuartii]